MASNFYWPDKEDPYHVSRHAESKMTMKLMTLAEKHCEAAIQAYNECARGRHMSMIWACRSLYQRSQDCVHNYVNDHNLATVKRRWVDAGRPRKPHWDELLGGMDVPPRQTASDAAGGTAAQQPAV